MDSIKVKTVLSNLTKGGKPCYQLYVKDAKPMSQDDFVKKFAAAIGKTAAEARFIRGRSPSAPQSPHNETMR